MTVWIKWQKVPTRKDLRFEMAYDIHNDNEY